MSTFHTTPSVIALARNTTSISCLREVGKRLPNAIIGQCYQQKVTLLRCKIAHIQEPFLVLGIIRIRSATKAFSYMTLFIWLQFSTINWAMPNTIGVQKRFSYMVTICHCQLSNAKHIVEFQKTFENVCVHGPH